MHRMRYFFAKAGLTIVLASALAPLPAARADLIQRNAAQSFPDTAGLFGSQTYTYDPATHTGTFAVNNVPSVLAIGASPTSDFIVNDPSGQARSESITVKLDPNGNLVSDPGNSFSMYGSVTVNGKSYSGLLLQGTPTSFGWAPTDSVHTPTVSNFDMNVNLTGGLLQGTLYGSTAYVRVSSELASTFTGSFTQDFTGLKTSTNVRSYETNPSPVPEPSTFAILLACSGAGLLYHQRRRIDVADLTAED